MFYSFKELKRLAGLNDSTSIEEISSAITSLGFEVEGYEKFADVEGVKFGKILKISKNPDADGLNVCEIEFDDKTRTIQTNASNVFEGMVVVAFIPGSRSGSTVFDAKELRGIVSEGMLSNPTEFGISKDLLREGTSEGIFDYKGYSIDQDPIKELGLDDYIIEVDILSNRSDAHSYYVMAKELAAYFKTETDIPSLQEANIQSEIKVTNGKAISLAMVEAKNDFEITAKEQILLAKHKIKTINNPADLSNLTLIYAGQPTHVYNKEQVGNSFTAEIKSGDVKVFGDKEFECKDNLVITNDENIVSIASVIGIEKYAVKEEAKEIIIELGIFPNEEVRKSVVDVKLNTTASSQGMKTLSKGTTMLSMIYLSNKLKNFSSPINFELEKPKPIKFSEKKVSIIAGKDITKEEKYKDALESLRRLEFVLESETITPPAYRHDIEGQQDLNEEVFRLYGFDNFEEKAPTLIPHKVKNVVDFKEHISFGGFQEVRTYSLISEERNIINPFDFKEQIKLKTFVSKEREVIRDSQAESLLEVATHNIKRGMKDINIFSQGMINNGVKTMAMLSTTKTFEEMKKQIVNIIPEVEFERFSPENIHPNVSAKIIFDKEMIGWIGKVHPKHTKVNGFIVEFIIKDYSSSKAFNEYSSDPLKFEDINIILEKGEDISPKLKEYKDAFEVKIIDQYEEGDKIKVTIRVIK